VASAQARQERLFLAFRARAAEFDTGFYAVQALELAAGAANIALLGLNMRDKMKGRASRSGRRHWPDSPLLARC
jgi:hypothetical protein